MTREPRPQLSQRYRVSRIQVRKDDGTRWITIAELPKAERVAFYTEVKKNYPDIADCRRRMASGGALFNGQFQIPEKRFKQIMAGIRPAKNEEL